MKSVASLVATVPLLPCRVLRTLWQRRAALAVLVVASCFQESALAAPFASRAIRMIVPWPAGGITDVNARSIAVPLSKQFGQVVVVENRPGASGAIGITQLVKSPKDGYTIGFGSANDLAIAQALKLEVPYEVDRDLVPIGGVYSSALVLIVKASLPVRSMSEFYTYAKSRPGGLRFGTFGAATHGHIAGELLAKAIGAPMVFVHYKGGTPVLTALAAEEIDAGFGVGATITAFIDAGRVRPIMVTGRRRLAFLPDVPSAGETQSPLAEITSWAGLFAPTGTPGETVGRLNAELNRALHDPDVVAAFSRMGSEALPGKPEEFAAFVSSERVKWARLVRETGVKNE